MTDKKIERKATQIPTYSTTLTLVKIETDTEFFEPLICKLTLGEHEETFEVSDKNFPVTFEYEDTELEVVVAFYESTEAHLGSCNIDQPKNLLDSNIIHLKKRVAISTNPNKDEIEYIFFY